MVGNWKFLYLRFEQTQFFVCFIPCLCLLIGPVVPRKFDKVIHLIFDELWSLPAHTEYLQNDCDLVGSCGDPAPAGPRTGAIQILLPILGLRVDSFRPPAKPRTNIEVARIDIWISRRRLKRVSGLYFQSRASSNHSLHITSMPGWGSSHVSLGSFHWSCKTVQSRKFHKPQIDLLNWLGFSNIEDAHSMDIRPMFVISIKCSLPEIWAKTQLDLWIVRTEQDTVLFLGRMRRPRSNGQECSLQVGTGQTACSRRKSCT